MLTGKQGGIKYHFLSLWYDLTWDWTQVPQAIGKHSNHYANIQYCWRIQCILAYFLKTPAAADSGHPVYTLTLVFTQIPSIFYQEELYHFMMESIYCKLTFDFCVSEMKIFKVNICL